MPLLPSRWQPRFGCALKPLLGLAALAQGHELAAMVRPKDHGHDRDSSPCGHEQNRPSSPERAMPERRLHLLPAGAWLPGPGSGGGGRPCRARQAGHNDCRARPPGAVSAAMLNDQSSAVGSPGWGQLAFAQVAHLPMCPRWVRAISSPAAHLLAVEPHANITWAAFAYLPYPPPDLGCTSSRHMAGR